MTGQGYNLASLVPISRPDAVTPTVTTPCGWADPVLPQVIPVLPSWPTGNLFEVGSGKPYPATQAGLQAALDATNPNGGDIVQITAGTTILVGSGSIRLPIRNAGATYTLLRTSGHALLPPILTRINTTTDPAYMAKLIKQGTSGRVISTRHTTSPVGTAHHWILEGIEITGSHDTGTQFGLVSFGRDDTLGLCDNDAAEPHHVYVYNCWFHGQPSRNYRFGLEVACKHAGVFDSVIDEIHEAGADNQAISATSGTGGVTIDNCGLRGAGQVVFFGGGSNKLGKTYSDVTILRSDLGWDPTWSGYTLKNIFETKTLRRLLCHGTIFHDCWAGGQTGEILVLKEQSQDSWTDCGDFTFRFCKFYNGAGVAHFVMEDLPFSEPSRPGLDTLLIHDCMAWNINREYGRVASQYHEHFCEFTNADAKEPMLIRRSRLRNNTFVHDDFGQSTGTCPMALRFILDKYEPIAENLCVVDNVMTVWAGADTIKYGIMATNPVTLGTAGLNRACTSGGYRMEGNLLIGNYDPAILPANNTKAADYAAAKFVDWAGGDLTLAGDSPGKGIGISGGDAGAEMPALELATSHCIDGDWNA